MTCLHNLPPFVPVQDPPAPIETAKHIVCYRVPRSRSAQTHKFVAARLIAPMEPERGFISFVPTDFSVPGGEQEQTQKCPCSVKRAGRRASGGQRD